MSDDVPEQDFDRSINLEGSSESGDASGETPPPPPGAPSWSLLAIRGSEGTPQLTSFSTPATSEPLFHTSSSPGSGRGTQAAVSDPRTNRGTPAEGIVAGSAGTVVASDSLRTHSAVSDPDLVTAVCLSSTPIAPSKPPTDTDSSFHDIVSSNPADPLPVSESLGVGVASGSSHPADPEIKESEDRVDSTLLAEVLDLGFDEAIVRIALSKTKGEGGAEAAINWILEHSNESDFESEDEEGEDSMGAVQSSFRPHKMVFVANMGLKMGAGKLAAQVGHATLGVYRVAQQTAQGEAALSAWRAVGEMKVVLKGESTEQLLEMFKLAKDLNLSVYLVADAGRTQIPAGSRTVLGVFGPSEVVDLVTGSLKLL